MIVGGGGVGKRNERKMNGGRILIHWSSNEVMVFVVLVSERFGSVKLLYLIYVLLLIYKLYYIL